MVEIRAPASNGPASRDAFIDTPFRARAAGSCGRGTSVGTSAASTGQRSARPTPLAKVRASNNAGVIAPPTFTRHSEMATAALQHWVATRKRRRSSMSASAPLGKPSRKTGSVAALCTSATHSGAATPG
jgi:hypothetical protein